ncbi:MAG TPA: nuclear transport factor 2 family protein [Streptosporangiaceae bacterium]|nr:nuclear transport factor 2 family protein [Streptosporangiaceae bacterium]
MATTTAAETAATALRDAMQARDVDAVVSTFAPDATFRSPLTDRLAFTGHAQIRALTCVLFDLLKDLEYTSQATAPGTATLAWHARLAGQPIDGIDLLQLNQDGKIQEFSVYLRPLPAAATALHTIPAALARAQSPARATTIAVLTQPLVLLTRAGDRLAPRLLGTIA